jgi:hypothetical protein
MQQQNIFDNILWQKFLRGKTPKKYMEKLVRKREKFFHGE